MKRIYIAAFLLLFSSTALMRAKPGCMSKSQHLKQKFDTKAYHYVACTCPCDSYRPKGLYMQRKNTCLQCQHQHDPRPVLIIDRITQSNAKNSLLPESAQVAMYRMIARWRSNQ